MLASDTWEIKGNNSELVCPTIWRCIAPKNAKLIVVVDKFSSSSGT